MKSINNIIEWVKLKPRYLIGISTVCFVIVCLPKSIRLFLGYEDIIVPYKGLISLIGIFSGVYGIVIWVTEPDNLIKRKLKKVISKKNAIKVIQQLHPQEKMYLAEYLKKRTLSLDFNISNGIVNNLIAKKVLHQGSSVSKIGMLFPFNIQPWVLEILENNPDLKKDILENTSNSDLEDHFWI